MGVDDCGFNLVGAARYVDFVANRSLVACLGGFARAFADVAAIDYFRVG